jgi:hypothetical protein
VRAGVMALADNYGPPDRGLTRRTKETSGVGRAVGEMVLGRGGEKSAQVSLFSFFYFFFWFYFSYFNFKYSSQFKFLF